MEERVNKRELFSWILTSDIAIKLYPGFFVILLYVSQTFTHTDARYPIGAMGDLLLLLAPVYILLLLLIPHFFRKKRYLLFTLFSIVLVVLSGLLPNWLECFYAANKQATSINFSNALILFILTLGYDLSINYFKEKEKQKQLERQRLETELQMLRMQMNPHFLFNSLNSLYGLALSKSDRLPDLLMRLSELLRYLHDERKHSKVPLGREIEFLENYINLQKVRLPDHVTVDMELNGDPEGRHIAPALLIHFLENAFKHLNTESAKAFVQIRIGIRDKELTMEVRNSKADRNDEERNGSGLSNMRKRLDLLYPNAYYMQTEEGGNFFWAYLKLELS